MQIGDQINNLRKKEGMSQDQFAEQFHVSRQTVSNWETGKSYPDLEMLLKISDYFKVSIDDLLKQDKNTAAKMEDPKKKSKRYWGIFIVALVLSVVTVTGIWWHFKSINSVAFTMESCIFLFLMQIRMRVIN